MAATAARGRAGDVARWLRVLQAPGTHVPAISLLPDTMRALHSGVAEPQRRGVPGFGGRWIDYAAAATLVVVAGTAAMLPADRAGQPAVAAVVSGR